jgi:hypothetical protein
MLKRALVLILVLLAALITVLVIRARRAEAAAMRAPDIYNVAEAYEVYSEIIPDERSIDNANGKIVVQQETESNPFIGSPDTCFDADVVTEYREAFDGYRQANSQRWTLRPAMQFDRSFEMITKKEIDNFFRVGPPGWQHFYQHHPNSGGYVEVSAIGFNREHTVALVYVGNSCGGQCGDWTYHLLQRDRHGKWTALPVRHCTVLSYGRRKNLAQ